MVLACLFSIFCIGTQKKNLISKIKRFVCNHFWVLFEVHFRSLSCWKTHDLWWRRSFLKMKPQNYLVIIRFHDTIHTVKVSSAKSSKATPKHLWTSTMFDCRDRVLYFEGLISFSVKSAMSPLPKSSTFVSSVHSTFSQKDCGFGKLQSCFLCLCVSSGVLLGLPFYSDDSAS